MTAVGDGSDLYLVFPEFAGRFRPMAKGDSLDLGGTEFGDVEAVLREYIYTPWSFETRRRNLFAAMASPTAPLSQGRSMRPAG